MGKGRQRWCSFWGRLCQVVAMAPREDGQLFSEGMYSGINHTQKPSLLPGLNAGWRDLGGLALTFALQKAAICIEKGSVASERIITLH